MQMNNMQTRLLTTGVRIVYTVLALGIFGLILSRVFFRDDLSSERSINVLAWVDTIDTAVLKAFEKKTNIKVNVTHFESNEELFVKLYITKGKGYDLIMPSDYCVKKLIAAHLVKPIDHSKLHFLNRLLPFLLNHSFDPSNVYSIPYCWTLYGIGYNTRICTEQLKQSWSDLFSQPNEHACTIGMVNAAREAFSIGALHQFKTLFALDDSDSIEQVYKALAEQKPYIESYVDADFRANYLLSSGQAGKAVVTSGNILPFMVNNNHIQFYIPKEGAFLLIDNFMITGATTKDTWIYEFLNFIYDRAIVRHHMNEFPLIIAVEEAEKYMVEKGYDLDIVQEHFHSFKNRYSFDDIGDNSLIGEKWFSLKIK